MAARGSKENEVNGNSSEGKIANKSGKMNVDVIDSEEEDYNVDVIDVEEEHYRLNMRFLEELGSDFFKNFCKDATKAFFTEYGFVGHQLNSYNHFIKYGIQNVFDSVGEIIVEIDPSERDNNAAWRYASVKFGKVTLEKPTFWAAERFVEEKGKDQLDLHPRHARLQNMTYAARIRVKTHFQVYTKKHAEMGNLRAGKSPCGVEYREREEEWDCMIGKLPVMVGSDVCWTKGTAEPDCEFDRGGYFIIKGAEKVIIAQEQICLNRLWISKTPTWMVSYRPVSRRKRVFMKLVDSKDRLDKVITVYFLGAEMPIWILFFALGASSDREIVNLIDLDIENTRICNTLAASIYHADRTSKGFRKNKNALQYVDGLVKSSQFPPAESVEECLSNLLFPNLKGFKQKVRFLAYMVKCLSEAYTNRRLIDKRDDFRNKRVELAAELLERELKIHLKHAERRMIKLMQNDLREKRELRDIQGYLDPSIISNGLSRAFSTGGWSHPYERNGRVPGVVASLGRLNPLQTTADMRKTRLHFSYKGRVGEARYQHLSHWGKICFLSTPEGENSGLVKNLASLGLVSTTSTEPLLGNLLKCGMKELGNDTSSFLRGEHKVFVDGNWVGTCEDSEVFVADLKSMRRNNEIHHQVEIKRDILHNEVRIFTDAGRILRPLLVVDNLWKIDAFRGGDYPFQKLMDYGIVEFVGAEEEEDYLVAWGIEYLLKESKQKPPTMYTHCEIDQSLLLGLSCGIIPYANHNHARRTGFQAEKHSKQAIGFYSTNPNTRVDTNIHQLYYPQRPLFQTFLAECLGKPKNTRHKGMLPFPEFYNGQCAIVSVNVHHGLNQEDSLVMNRASVERGLFRSEHTRTYKFEVDGMETMAKRHKSVDSIKFGKRECFEKLDDDGFPYIGASLKPGDKIIGKYAESGKDHSVKLKHTERGVVQKVVLSTNDEGKTFAAVSLRQVRRPNLGDKFSSMHGQKGVIGLLESPENFPFTMQGIVPDIVINPHSFPSRQTPGQILESALAKGIALGGLQKYATPFSALSVDDIGAQLHRLGFSRWGNERVFDGRTGEMINSLIFIAPTFYQRLNHMAEDKVKYRNTGRVDPRTHQPVADKKHFGGLKFGEMERDCLMAHGAVYNLHERLVTLSDPSQMHICRKCRNAANVFRRPSSGGRMVRGPFCRICNSSEDIVKLNVPYGAKLIYQELLSLGIRIAFNTELE